MHSRRDQASAVANRDINPSDQLVTAYPDVACLIQNEAISQAFASYEKSALRWKRIYVFFGRLSLIAVMLAMVSYDYQITVHRSSGRTEVQPWITATDRILPVAIIKAP